MGSHETFYLWLLSGSKLSSVSLSALPPPPSQCPRNMRLRYCQVFQKLSLGETTSLPPIEDLNSLRASEIGLSRGQQIRQHLCAIVALLRRRPQTNPFDTELHPAGMSDRLREKWHVFRQRAKTAGNEENLSQWLSTLLTWAQEGDDAIQVLFAPLSQLDRSVAGALPRDRTARCGAFPRRNTIRHSLGIVFRRRFSKFGGKTSAGALGGTCVECPAGRRSFLFRRDFGQ